MSIGTPDDELAQTLNFFMTRITMKISIQLYTLRDLTKTDFAGVISKLSHMGYRGVELAGFGNLTTAKDVKKVLDDNGVVASGAQDRKSVV